MALPALEAANKALGALNRKVGEGVNFADFYYYIIIFSFFFFFFYVILFLLLENVFLFGFLDYFVCD